MVRISEKTDDHAKLSKFIDDIKVLPDKASKAHRFTALLAELCPWSEIITDYEGGIGEFVRVHIKLSRNYRGNVIIEFDDSLETAGSGAERQLREFIAVVWNKQESWRHLVLSFVQPIATDGITWRTYRPSLKKEQTGTIQPDDVELEFASEISVSDKTFLSHLWIMFQLQISIRPA